jgi:pimeloyl-ACP methyl ester carboxylesterase
LDYRAPNGRAIDITVSRIATAEAGVRQGILLSNPGGPGNSGLNLPSALAAVMPTKVLDRYDLIGFDPRGIGHSTPVSCGANGTLADPTLILPYPAPDGSIDRNVAFAKATAANCAAVSGDLLPFITTANTARDMDRIRMAIGEPKLSYFGLSYGTYLGAVYTSLFPNRTDRMVLDSAVDPRVVWRNLWPMWNHAVALRFPDFQSFAAAQDETYHLGATPAEVRSTVDRIIDALDRSPVPVPGGPLLDSNYLREIIRSLLYADFFLPTLADLLRTVRDILDGSAVDTVALRPALNAVSRSTRVAADVPADNFPAALYAVVCDDVAWPTTVAHHTHDVTIARKTWPLTAGMPSNIWPCAFWPTRPVESPISITDRGPRNVLILQNTRDPATPWLSGFGLRTALGQRAAMVTVDQGGHGVYTLGSCADEAADTYLATGVLPARDRFCTGNPTPAGLTARPRLSPTGPL